ILQKITSVKVNIRSNFVRGQIPGLIGEANTDVSADLADPHPAALKRIWRQPEPGMNALGDRGSRLLQDEVFLATKCIEGADRGGQKLVSKYECARSVDCA